MRRILHNKYKMKDNLLNKLLNQIKKLSMIIILVKIIILLTRNLL